MPCLSMRSPVDQFPPVHAQTGDVVSSRLPLPLLAARLLNVVVIRTRAHVERVSARPVPASAEEKLPEGEAIALHFR